ncbi:MAG: 50S ribosomal protein L23 [Candidatus Pacebacteria bacterium]|nr:50S ribosomal protein L23 [Candidatus Paceibacterota bacterium]
MGLFFRKTKKEESYKDKKQKEPSFTSAEIVKSKKEKPVKTAKTAKTAKTEAVKKTASASAELRRGKKGDIKTAPSVLSRPQITEKATLLQEQDQYVFQVFKTATKPAVKKALEEVYGVNVEQVRIINVDRKKRRLGRTTGWKRGYKKAIVKIRKGQVIEIMPR